MRFIVTGGEGFIGRRIVEVIRKNGDEAISMDIAGSPDIRTDLMDTDLLRTSFKGIDGVFHLAAITSPPQFEEDLLKGFNNNVTGTLNVLYAAAKSGVRRVVFASSSSTYGNSKTKTTEDMQTLRHENMYPITKIIGERLGDYFFIRNELEFVSLRYFNTYGPGENTKSLYSSVIWQFVRSSMKGEDIIIYGDGTQSRDFIHVDDVARATVSAFHRGKNGSAYNVGSGVSRSFNEIASAVKEAIRSESRIKHVPNPLKNYQMFTQADINAIRKDTGWSPTVDLNSGIISIRDGERFD